MPGPEDQGEGLKTPPSKSERTTPYGSEATTALPTPAPESLQQRYEVLGELGRGGMGIVYRARDRETGEVVALKVIHPQIAADPAILERFKNELRLARKITHKNVCRMYELLRFDQTAVIAMEYVEGDSLRAVLDRFGGVPLRRGLEWARQMCDALAEAHGQGVIHRDLKPENILIDRQGQAKVMDFGIARSVESQATGTGGVIGTPAYMSPEQAEGKPLDARSDIYALGLVFYEMFTGRRVFEAETPAALVHKHVYETPARPRSIEPLLPEFLDEVIAKCLEKKPEKRFKSVGDIRVALEGQGVAEVSQQGEPQPAPHLCVWSRRDWVLLVLGVAGLLYFLSFRGDVFPAFRMRLEVDASTARRVTQDTAQRLGRRFPVEAVVLLEFQGEQYRDSLLSTLLNRSEQRSGWDLIREVEFPLQWRVQSNPRQLFEFAREAKPYALVDRKGKLQELFHPFSTVESIPPIYQAPAPERRRELAKEAAQGVCGALPEPAQFSETSGGDRGAAYSATWLPLRGHADQAGAEVSLLAERIVHIKCNLSLERPALPFLPGTGRGFYVLFRGWMVVMIGALMVYCGLGRCHKVPGLTRRMPSAVALGLVGAWLFVPMAEQMPNTGTIGAPASPYSLLLGGVALAGLLLVGVITVEHYLLRRAPAYVATWIMLRRWRLSRPALGLAVVRGAFIGLVLIAVETLAVHGVLSAPIDGKLTRIPLVVFGGFVDPTVLGQALATFSSALFVAAAAVFNGFVIGVLFLGGVWGTSTCKEFLKYPGQLRHQLPILFVMASLVTLLMLAARLHLGQALGWGLGFIVVPILMIFVLVTALVLYDVLTVAVAAGTAVLWTLNYPLLEILADLGNGSHWTVFAAWGAVVLAAAVVAFRPAVEAARRSMAGEFE